MRLVKFMLFLLPFACCSTLTAQEVKIVKFAPGAALVVIDSEAKGEITWRLDKRLRDLGMHYKDLANKRLVIGRPAGGNYEILGITLEGAKITFTDWLLIVEGPGPGPGPDPVPETLETKFKLAYEIDKASGKGDAVLKGKLANLYTGLASFTDQAIIKTIEAAHVVSHGAVDALLMGNLPTLAKAADDHMHAKITEPEDTVLTQALRDRFKAVFLEIGKAIGAEPGPGPTPTVGNIKVLISYESSSLSPELNKIISGVAVRGYVTSKGTKDNGVAPFRAFDKDLNVGKELPWVQAADKRRREKAGSAAEWIVIQNDAGVIVHDGPLPKTEAETVTLLKRFGG